MALNIRRGLFRLWAVFSCLWVVVATIIAYESFQFGHRYVWYHDQKTVSETTEYAMEKYIAFTKQYEIDSFSRPIVYVGTYVEETEIKDALNTASNLVRAKERGRALSALLDWAGGAFVPPTTVLAIGAALYWALLGFRARTS